MLTATLLAAACLPWAESAHLDLTPRVLSAVAVTGLVCSALGFTVQAWAQKYTSATNAALIFSSEPVFAWITSAIVIHERFGPRATIGALLILAGILAAELLGRQGPEAIQS
jgi:drug/metabolite transporter (DMT)-like permease